MKKQHRSGAVGIAILQLAAAAAAQQSANAAKLYWTQHPIVDRVQRANPDGSQVEPLIEWPMVDEPIAVQVDPYTGRVYWAQQLGDRILRTDASGANAQTLLEWPATDDVTAIAIDPIGWKLYWAQSFDDRILRCDLNGANVQTILEWPSVNNPTAMVLDSAAGKIYWAQTGTGGDDRIQRANLDGTGIEILLEWPEVDDPVGLALDPTNGKMYWVQTLLDGALMRSDLLGVNVEIVLEWPEVNEPVAVALGGGDGKIYWAQSYESRVRRSNLDSSGVETVLAWPTSDTPTALAIVPEGADAACPAPLVAGEGSRYLKVTVPSIGTSVAIRVSADLADSATGCRFGYVQANCQGGSAAGQACSSNATCPGGLCMNTGTLGPNPVFRTTGEWGTVAVRSEWLSPGSVAEVQLVCGSGASASASAIATGTTARWGDTDNNGLVNFVDISRTVAAFQGKFSGALTLEQTDVMGVNCLPNRIANFQDISSTVDAFQGRPFPACLTCP